MMGNLIENAVLDTQDEKSSTVQEKLEILDKLSSQMNSLIVDVATLKTDLSDAKNNTSSKDNSADVDARLASVEQEIKNLSASISLIDDALKDIEVPTQALQKVLITEIDDRCAPFEKIQQSLSQTLSELHTQSEQLTSTVDIYQASGDSLSSLQGAVDACTLTVNQKLGDINGKTDALVTEIERAKESAAKLEKKLGELDENQDEFIGLNRELFGQLNTFVMTLETATNQADRSLELAQKYMMAIPNTLAKFSDDIDSCAKEAFFENANSLAARYRKQFLMSLVLHLVTLATLVGVAFYFAYIH